MSTDRSRPIQGYREPEQPKSDNPVDPDKFQQELMKVSESDESKKRQQRNLKKREEEGGDTEEEAAASQAPPTANVESFSAFMGQGSDLESAFSVKNPQSVRTIQTTSSGEAFTLDGEDLENRMTPTATPVGATGEMPPSPGPTLGSTQGYQAPSASPSGATPPSSPTPPVSSTPSPQQPSPSQAPSTPSSEPSIGYALTGDYLQPGTSFNETTPSTTTSESSTDRAAPQSKVQDQSLYARKGQSIAQKQKKTTPSRELKIESAPPKEALSATVKKSEQLPAQKPISSSTKQTITQPGLAPLAPQAPSAKPEVSQEAKETFFQQVTTSDAAAKLQKTTPNEKKLEPISETGKLPEEDTVVQSRKEPPQEKSKDGEKDKQKQEDESLQMALPVMGAFDIIPQITPPAPSAYSSLPPQLMELFDKMVGLIVVQQSTGITTTTVTLNMPNSIFNGAQIVLDHYAAAPNSFNVQLLGSPKAVDLFTSRMGDLVAAMEQNKQSFQINVQKPILLEEYRAFKRKEKTSDDEGKKDRRQRG